VGFERGLASEEIFFGEFGGGEGHECSKHNQVTARGRQRILSRPAGSVQHV
jgi:hypothetical protein